MELGLAGRSVLVMASSKGLGRAVARSFCAEGARVMISSREEESLRNTADLLRRETGAEVNYCVCDVTKPEQIRALVDRTVDLYGGVDVLVNNAGGPPAGSFQSLDDEAWEHAFQLNLLSYVRAIRAVLPHMQSKKGGHIVNIASSSVKEPIDGLILSNTFRSGVVGLAKTLSRELAADGVLINTVGPGKIDTGRVADLDLQMSEELGLSYEQIRSRAEAQIPLGRYGTPEEFARLIVFLCSPANTYVTGQVILVDGGATKAL